MARSPAHSPTALRKAAASCRHCEACPLYRKATQSVWGEGLASAPLMLVGEQPGDVEDIQGRPFVGPAGRLLRDLLDDLGLSRSPVYLTNAVKHFSFVERGKRRLHKKPTTGEVMACRPWILEELTIVRPRVVVALGATAALTLFGRQASVTRDRGKRLALSDEMQALVGTGLVTYHPSAALRAPSPEQRKQVRDWLRADLELAARLCSGDRHANDSTMAPPNAD